MNNSYKLILSTFNLSKKELTQGLILHTIKDPPHDEGIDRVHLDEDEHEIIFGNWVPTKHNGKKVSALDQIVALREEAKEFKKKLILS